MGQARLGHHRVNDQFADVKSKHRNNRPNQTESETRQRQRWARIPDKAEECRQIAQCADTLAKGLRGEQRYDHVLR